MINALAPIITLALGAVFSAASFWWRMRNLRRDLRGERYAARVQATERRYNP